MSRRICILESVREEVVGEAYSENVDQLVTRYRNQGDEVDYFQLRNLKIHPCMGCWDCWVKTPGQCKLKDDHEMILSAVVNADELLFLTELIEGFIDSKLKTTMDRLIPSIHPYIRFYKGEMHHHQRYELPDFHVRLIQSQEDTKEEMALAKKYFQRVSLNMSTSLRSMESISGEGEGINEFINL